MIADSARERAQLAAFDFLFWLQNERRPAKRKPVAPLLPPQPLMPAQPRRGKGRPIDKTAQIVAWLTTKGEATTEEICARFGMNRKAFNAICRRNSGRIVRMTDDRQPGVWKVATNGDSR